jgi:hypothetical protein
MSTNQAGSTAAPAAAPKKSSFGRILVRIFLVFVLVIIGFLAYVSTRPDDFQITRSAVIGAPPDVVFPLVNNFHEWTKWSPWEKLDPKMKRTIDGPESGKDAHYSWEGDANVGSGEMTIAESKPNELIGINLHFIKPFEGVSPTRFTFAPADGGTKVTWAMKGQYNFITKIMCMFMNMDKMIGDNFEDGLKQLDTLAKEQAGQPQAIEKTEAASDAEPKADGSKTTEPKADEPKSDEAKAEKQ